MNIIHSDSLPPRGHALATGAHSKGNGGGDPALATDVHEGNRGNGNSKGGPVLATDAHRNNNGNGDVRGPPALGKVMSYGTDTAAGAATDDAKCCHKQGINKRQRPRHHGELRQDGG